MKKLVLFFTFALGGLTTMWAQEKTLLDVSQARTVNLVVDFSGASIHNLSEEEFADYEPDYASKKPEVIAKLVEEFNDSEKCGFILGNFPNAAYMIKIKVMSVNKKGDMHSDIEVCDAEGNVIATLLDVKGDGGTFGTKMNLIGDGCKSTGEVLAKRLAKQIKAEKKKAKK